jgi:indole-3-glycerol phosphate synthase
VAAVGTYLDEIVAHHRARAAADTRPHDALEQAARAASTPRQFAVALSSVSDVALIAEVKRRSPSKGVLAAELDPTALAAAYAAGGASCLSVLTDEAFFSGSRADLEAARSAVELPVLRKDFTVCERDVLDARAMGADAVLLIVAALEDSELARLHRLVVSLDMTALVEVHDEGELGRALDAGATVVGVNQRDLHSFAVDPDRAARVAAVMPDGVVRVAESGIRDRRDVERLATAGFDAALVGEVLVTAVDPLHATKSLLGRVRCS